MRKSEKDWERIKEYEKKERILYRKNEENGRD